MTSPIRRCMATAAILVAVLMQVTLSGAERADDVAAEVRRLNQTWRGAECVLRLPLEIRKKPNREGWYRTWWLVKTAGPDKDSGFSYQFWISDLDAVRHHFDGHVIRPGTRFIFDRWGFDDPEKAKGLFLELHFADAPVRARWEITTKTTTTESKVTLPELRYVESYMRIQAHQIHTATERLVEVATPPPQPTAPPSFRAGSARSDEPEVFKPEIRLHAVAVQPARIRVGAEVRLIVSYEVTGLPRGTRFEVTETRRLMAGDRLLTSFDDHIPRTAGSFTSELPVHIPDNLAPGVYTLEVSVEVAGATAAGSAIFEVLDDHGDR